MKKIVMACYFAAGLFGVAAAQASKVKFMGNTDTVYNGVKVVLYNKATKDHDSAYVKNGHFEITVEYKEPTRYMFYSEFEMKKKGGYAPYGILVAKPGEVKMRADLETLANSSISDAPENSLYNEYSALGNASRQKIMDKLGEKYGKDFIAKPDPKDPKYKDMVADYKAMADADQPAEIERLKNFIRKNPSSFAAIYLLANASYTLPNATIEEMYGMVAPAYKASSYGKRISEHIEAAKITAIGKIAPDFEQPDTAGNIVKLSGLRGKYLLVDFWASWCGPCRAENPNVVKAFNQYKEKGFNVLGVSLDQPGKKEAWLKAIYKDNLTWTQVSDLKFWDNAVAKLYGIQAIPQNFLLDPQGKIIAANIRGDELNNKLKTLFPN